MTVGAGENRDGHQIELLCNILPGMCTSRYPAGISTIDTIGARKHPIVHRWEKEISLKCSCVDRNALHNDDVTHGGNAILFLGEAWVWVLICLLAHPRLRGQYFNEHDAMVPTDGQTHAWHQKCYLKKKYVFGFRKKFTLGSSCFATKVPGSSLFATADSSSTLSCTHPNHSPLPPPITRPRQSLDTDGGSDIVADTTAESNGKGGETISTASLGSFSVTTACRRSPCFQGNWPSVSPCSNAAFEPSRPNASPTKACFERRCARRGDETP